MATMRRRSSTRSARRTTSSRRSTSKRSIRPASEVRGRDVVSAARRKIAKGAGKISREFNREIA